MKIIRTCGKCGKEIPGCSDAAEEDVDENDPMLKHWAAEHRVSDIFDLPAFREAFADDADDDTSN